LAGNEGEWKADGATAPKSSAATTRAVSVFCYAYNCAIFSYCFICRLELGANSSKWLLVHQSAPC
jgi:hypothetical protein